MLKNLIERERPPLASRLVVTSGYSFPSGHSLASAALLMAFAVIVCRHLQSRLQQVTVFTALGLLMCAVAASRVYLGVHYPTDAVGAVFFGMGWICVWWGVLSSSPAPGSRSREPAQTPSGG